MGQITSREELEEWFNKHNRPDFVHVIAARAALRVLPYAFVKRTPQKWVNNFALGLLRALSISWAARNFPGHSMARATAYAARAANAAAYAADTADAANAAAVAYAALAATYVADAADAVAAAVAAETDVWANVNADCNALDSDDTAASAASRLTGLKLWPAGEPKGWAKVRDVAYARLAALVDGDHRNQQYQVWIDWYEHRITGHDAAFDIPGDTDRIHDKAILIRLAQVTDQDFWGKGGAYVNTTLQRWIHEAREQAAADFVASSAPQTLGSAAELAARAELVTRLDSVERALAALKDQLASLTDTGHGGIGHNLAENATSLRDDEIITLKQQVASLETLLTGVQTQLATPVPDMGQLVQDVPKLNRWGRAMCVMAEMSSDKVAEGFEKEIGAAGAKGLVAGLVAVVLAALAGFSHYFYTYWIPLLIG
jgi:hypothetical protein